MNTDKAMMKMLLGHHCRSISMVSKSIRFAEDSFMFAPKALQVGPKCKYLSHWAGITICVYLYPSAVTCSGFVFPSLLHCFLPSLRITIPYGYVWIDGGLLNCLISSYSQAYFIDNFMGLESHPHRHFKINGA